MPLTPTSGLLHVSESRPCPMFPVTGRSGHSELRSRLPIRRAESPRPRACTGGARPVAPAARALTQAARTTGCEPPTSCQRLMSVQRDSRCTPDASMQSVTNVSPVSSVAETEAMPDAGHIYWRGCRRLPSRSRVIPSSGGAVEPVVWPLPRLMGQGSAAAPCGIAARW